jgi:alpha-glucosidase
VVMTRASYAGGQRYAVTWTGDNSSSWEHLKLSVHQAINLGLSGFAFNGADVGGFTGGPSADLLTRWYQYAAFAPIFRNHATKGSPFSEPWVDGHEHLGIRRRYIEERYRLMPYLYALAANAARTGEPLVRPLFYDHPGAGENSCDNKMTFTLGRDLVIAGNPRPEADNPYTACLPAGVWYDYWTGERRELAGKGGGQAPIQPRIDELPVFVRAGSILPRQTVVQSTLETPAGPLALDVFPGPDCEGELYDDDGHSMAFAADGYYRQLVRCELDGGRIARIVFTPAYGKRLPWWHDITVTIHGAAKIRPRLGKRALSATTQNGGATFTMPLCAKGCTVELGESR